MPALANITVFKYDGVTNVTWAGITPNGGDNQQSLFRSDTAFASVPLGYRPVLKTRQHTAASGSRVTQMDGAFPHTYTETTTGLVKMMKGVTMKVIISVEPGVPFTTQAEGAYQLLNLAASALLKEHAMQGVGLTS